MPTEEERRREDDEFWASVLAKPKAMFPTENGLLSTEYDTEKEAFDAVARWNKTHAPVQSKTSQFKTWAYVIAGGVRATDPLHPWMG